MKIALLASIISGILFYIQIPISIIYIISFLSIGISLILLYPIKLLPSTLIELNTAFSEKVYTKWYIDIAAHNLIMHLQSVLLLQVFVLGPSFFLTVNIYLLLLFLSVGTLITTQQLILYLRENYLNELNTLLENLHNDN